MNLSEFFVCHSPFSGYPDIVETHFYHDDKPKFFASLLAIDPLVPVEDIHYDGDNLPFIYMRPDGRMKLYIILIDKHFDRPSAKLSGALQKAALWYCSFLNTADKVNKGKGSGWNLLDNFNALTPGLQLINFEDQKIFLLSYPGGIKTFGSRGELDDFMSLRLGYNDAQLAKGSVNMIGTKGQLQK